MRKFIAAAIQLDSKENKAENLKQAEYFIKQAVECGAKVIVLPENSNYCGKESLKNAENIMEGESIRFFSKMAEKYGVWLNCGSIYKKTSERERPLNCSLFFNAKGEVVAQYCKMHPFDVSVENGPKIKESNKICPGEKIEVYDTNEIGTYGFSICYDIRFGEMFRLMALKGAEVFFTPADFTYDTGKAHWEPILRTRAIENGCYVIAPCQCGNKPYYKSNGNSMIIDPWGSIIARAEEKPCFISAEIDLDMVERVRKQLGILENRRTDIYNLKEV